MKLLLHTCCAPCSVYCLKTLRKEGIEPTLFWYNPNIHPYSEYKTRRDCLKSYAKEKQVELIIEDEYGLDEFLCNVLKDADKKDFTETMISRCQNYCYPKRLREVFEYAKGNNYLELNTQQYEKDLITFVNDFNLLVCRGTKRGKDRQHRVRYHQCSFRSSR